MNEGEKIPNPEEEIASRDETISKRARQKTTKSVIEDPKHARLQKGVSGNPNGRPKESPDFDYALFRGAKSRISNDAIKGKSG